MPSGFPDYEYFEIPLPVAQGGTGLTQWDGARVHNSAIQTIPNNADTALTFDSERYDNGGLHSTTINPSRLTAQKAGKYLIWGCWCLWPSATGKRFAYLRVNGATRIATCGAMGSADIVFTDTISALYHLAVGDYVELVLVQFSGGDLISDVSWNMYPEFAMQWVGP